MRLAFVISAVGHAVLVALAFIALAHPRLLDATTQTVTVDIVAADEIAAPQEAKRDRPAEKRADDRERPATDAPPQPQTGAMAARDPAAMSPAPGPAPPDSFAAAPLFLPTLLPGLGEFEFDAPAEQAAKLSADEMTALQAHLQKCWHPPAAIAGAQKLRTTLRVALAPNGALAREPMLIRASASAQGPRLVQTATRALQECQPFAFLPADKYQEWKVLDLSFSPKGLL